MRISHKKKNGLNRKEKEKKVAIAKLKNIEIANLKKSKPRDFFFSRAIPTAQRSCTPKVIK